MTPKFTYLSLDCTHGVGTVEKINFKFIVNSNPYVIDLTNS